MLATPNHPYKRGAVLQQSIFGGRTGHAITGVRPKNKKHDIALQPRGSQTDYSLVAPIRQTASIFKQPVTVYKEHKSKVVHIEGDGAILNLHSRGWCSTKLA